MREKPAQTVLVTGARGFIGANLVDALSGQQGREILTFDLDSDPMSLHGALASADVVFHLAGVNRPKNVEEYDSGNAGFTRDLCLALAEQGRTPLVVFASSTQALLDNPYGKSKRAAEEALREWSRKTGAPVAVFRLPNVFGKWGRPNYNSAVATFCYNAARGLDLPINNRDASLSLVYVDDVIAAFLESVEEPPCGFEFREATPVFQTTVGELADLILGFAQTRESQQVPDLSGPFISRLYATYISYLPEDSLAYALSTSRDARGVLAEFLKQAGFGQIFVSRTAPGVTRGNHYHRTKTEKFLVLEGEATIRLRDVRGGPVIAYRVDGRDFRVIDIPPGYTHSIQNVGSSELVTLFYASEVFDPLLPDTFPLPVLEESDHEKARGRE